MVRASDVSAGDVAAWLDAGATVVVPTETVYGLLVKAGDAAATRRVYELKGRPADMNLPVVIGAVEQLDALAVEVDDAARRLAAAFWPGPLTIVMGLRSDWPRPPWLSARDEVAIRFPDFALLRDVAAIVGPMLLTSANGHGTGAKTIAADAVASLHGAADHVIDGGALTSTPSTIVNTRVRPIRIERTGAISETDLLRVVHD